MSENQISPKSSPNSPGGGEYLSLLLAVAFLLFLMRAAFPWLLAIASGVGGWMLWRYYSYQSRRLQQRLDTAFYALIREHQGRITPLDLALATQLPGPQVQAYLDQKALEFAAEFEVTDDGRIFYTFSTVASVTVADPEPAIDTTMATVADPEPVIDTQVVKVPRPTVELPPVSVNQTPPDQGFDVPNTIRPRKPKPVRPYPEAIACEYSQENQEFPHPPELPRSEITELMERNRLGDR
ncbi:hypothetical protein, partial [Arthrospira platensis]|uniref:hypothetical protein n=1 Tax=Limnospira platensis TaxID=118562 RepID=UPI000292396C